ncbi:MAG: prepilin-type N-terminal cleavage/methylation domain-containing protein [bacterium]|nr:prepilin-type N-terminal cleavage/methylation domain-containing protein [bacterium]
MTNNQQPTTNRGFTLTELLISVVIVSVILTVVVSRQSTYTDSVALANLADEISSMVFQTQAYSIGVKEFPPGSGNFSTSYGLTFSLLGSGSNTAYLSFADRNHNEIYDDDWSCPIEGLPGAAPECIERIDISGGNYIESLCAVRTLGPGAWGPKDICNVGRIDISFGNSSSETRILFFNTGGELFNPAYDIEGAKIVLKSPGGLNWSVIVYNTGQVSVLKSESMESGTQ